MTDATGRSLPARLEVCQAHTLKVRVEDGSAVYPVRIDPTYSDAEWVGVDTGLNGTVRAVTVKGSTIFVGGDFTTAGTVTALRVARWTGAKWFAMGSGMNGTVMALIISGPDLYAGGKFTTAGGIDAPRIAKWNNTNWSGLGGGIDPLNTSSSVEVRALAARNTDVYIAGNFAKAGNTSVSNIVKWSTTSSAYSAMGNGTTGPVNALTFSGSILLVGGSFSGAGTVSAANIARWTGTIWNTAGSGVNGGVRALTASGSDVYVGGDFSTAGGSPANGIAKWNDTAKTWSSFGAGLSSVSAVAVTGLDVYAATGSKVKHWNGKEWLQVGSGTDGGVLSLALDDTSNLVAGGSFQTAGGASSPFFARIMLPTGPEITVFDSASPTVELDGESAALSFGEITGGSPVVKTFTLENYGVAALNVASLTLPPGFEQVGTALPGSAAVRTSLSYQVRFVGATDPGDYNGFMTLASNDPDEGELKIPITGKVKGTLTPVQNWRKQYFGITAGTGDAADNADPDGDGIVNLLEWSCHQDPTVAGSGPWEVKPADSALDFRYTRSLPARNSGVTYIVEWTEDPSAGAAWSTAGVSETVLDSTAETQQVQVLIPKNGTHRLFARLRVTSSN